MVVDGSVLAAVYADELSEDEIVEAVQVSGYISASFIVEAHQEFRDYVLNMPDFSVCIVHLAPLVKLFGLLEIVNGCVVA